MAREVPTTLERALDPAWLTMALEPVTGGAPVTEVKTVEVLKTVCTKVRFTAAFEGAQGGAEAFCLKAFLGDEGRSAQSGSTSIRECDFYLELAPKLSVQTADCVATVIDREGSAAAFIMRDLQAAGGRFCTALEAFDADRARASLEQLARLHVSHTTPQSLDAYPWVTRQVSMLADSNYFTPESLQGLLNDPRGEGLPARILDANLLLKAFRALAARDAELPQMLIHGDCHAGNIFETAKGSGLIDWQLIQRGNWSLDVAYHLAAILSVEMAEREERALLAYYLDTVRGLGGVAPDLEEAWTLYRTAAVYGYFLWAITRRVDRPIINTFVNRLGMAVTRHDSYRLLGL
jgi:hypothetical protein